MPPENVGKGLPTYKCRVRQNFGLAPNNSLCSGIMSETFLWHDYETFGSDPRRDRPAQFAALRTDENLEPVEAPLVWYCKPADDVLPQPAACLITGITPQIAARKGVPETEFAGRIFEEMTRPGTCSVGFNNFRFDDEVTRFLLYRNYLDPYARERISSTSRFDLIDVARLTAALRPDGMSWPLKDDGVPSFRLGDLAGANGLDTRDAHDALADVEMTLGVARLIREKQPKLWSWALALRDRWKVEHLLGEERPLLHVSARYPAEQHCIAPVMPLGRHPRIPGFWLVWNLREDPMPFAGLDPEALGDRLWTAREDLPEGVTRLPVKTVRANRCPMLAPMNVLRPDDAERLNINDTEIARHRRALADHPELVQRIRALHDTEPSHGGDDPELALYSGFIPNSDRDRMALARSFDGAGLATHPVDFTDPRLRAMLPRYRARNWPHSLDQDERVEWDDYRRRRLFDDPELASIRVPQLKTELSALRQGGEAPAAILDALENWLIEIRAADLAP